MTMTAKPPRFGHAAISAGTLLFALGIILASCVVMYGESESIPPRVELEGSDSVAGRELGNRIPVFQQYEPDLGAYEQLGSVNSSIHSTSCDAVFLANSPERIRAITELRRRALGLGANGLINLNCSVGGFSSHDPSSAEKRDFRRRQDCIRSYGEDAMRSDSHESVGILCDQLRDSEDSDDEGPEECRYVTECSATAIKRTAAQQ